MKHRYSISIGEPWDFSSPDGQNIIKGVIIKAIDSHCIVFKTPYELEFRGKKGDVFILFPRHGSFEDLRKTDGVTVNIGLFLGSSIEGKSPKELERDSLFVMIGGIRR